MARAKGRDKRASLTDAVALYARVSTEDQAENETIKAQLDFLRRFADLHQLPVAGEYVDDGVSGTVPLEDRPEGQRLLADAEAGRFGAVVFMRVSRLGRSLRVLLSAHDALDRLGIAIRSATEPLDTGSPVGKFIFQLLGSVAELDHATIADQTSRGRDRVAAAGRYTGGPIPIGYDLDADGAYILSTRPVPQLGITEAELIRDIFQRIASGESTLSAEVQRLNALGIPRIKRYGGKAGRAILNPAGWRFASLHNVLHNPVYKGDGILDSRYGTVVRPAPAIVDAQTWQRAQEALTRNRNLARKNAKRTYLLRGLIRCATCGASYVGSAGRAGYRYRCGRSANRATAHPYPVCRAKTVPADWLEAAVWEECRAFILNPGAALDEARRKLRERMAASTAFEDRRRAILALLAEKEAERERALTAYRKGWANDEETERQIKAIAHEAGQLREELESIRAQTALIDAQEAYLTESAAMLGRLREELAAIEATNDLARKQEIIRHYVRLIEVETHRHGPRNLTAEVRVYLRLRPEPIAVDTSTRPGDGREGQGSRADWPKGCRSGRGPRAGWIAPRP